MIQANKKMEKIRSFDDIKTEVQDLHINPHEVKKCGEHIENLVFEGGGIRGIAFGGAARFIQEHDLLKNIKGLAGSSAGAIVAAGIAVGYESQEIIDILTQTDFNSFKDDSWFVIMDIIRLLSQYGIYKGDAFYKWISDVLAKKTGDPKITFRQVYERYGKILVITGSCLNRAKSYYFNHQDPAYADMPVALAVRISMSIPIYWKAVNLGDDIMVDGGVLNNYPLFVFDGKFIGDTDVTDEQIAKSKTIGFKLMTSDERQDNTLYHVNEKIDGPVDFTKAFINALLIQIERGHIRSGYWDRTVCINTHNISSLDFSITVDQKKTLVDEGYIAAKNFFHCKIQGISNEMNRSIVRH
jgi:NTE family protein